MTPVALMQFLTRDLMRLTGVSRCLCIRAYDVTRDQHLFRWFGGGKTVGMRVPHQVDEKGAERYARFMFEVWQAAEAGPDDEAEYERLKLEAETVQLPWWEERMAPDAPPQQKPCTDG